MSESPGDDVLRDEPFRAGILASEVSFHGAVWDVRRDTFDLGGTELVREYQEHPGAVAVLAQDDQGNVLLIKQYRHPVGCRDWELPAGLLDVPGESPLDAAKRELAEEVDFEAAHWEPLCEFFSSPGGSSEVISVFVASGLTPTGRRFERTAEEAGIEIRWVGLSDAVAAVQDGRLRNGILGRALLSVHARA